MSAVDQITLDEMTAALLASGCDLEDERAVIRALNNAGHASGEVLVFADAAAVAAKNFKAGK